MAHSPVRPAFSEVVRGPLIPHLRWDPEGWSGLLDLRWNIPREHPVAIGAGWHRVEETQRHARQVKIGRRIVHDEAVQRWLVAEVVRRGRQQIPVLPGTSLKGAIRQVYELLTPSCIRGVQGRPCEVKARDDHGRVCPACSLFGALGYAGRLAFGEAAPERAQSVTERQVPNAWGKQKPVEGHVRVYHQSLDRDLAGDLRETPEWTRAVFGSFRSRVRLINATQEELGLLLAALGLGAPSKPGLRLGGKKFHGLGAVDPELMAVKPSYPMAPALKGEAADRWGRERVEAVLADPERRRAYQALHTILSTGA